MQPTLHESHVLLAAPTQVVVGRNGRIARAAEGIYHSDVRLVSRLRYDVSGTVDFVGTEVDVADRLVQRYIVRGVGEEGPDPELVMTRELHLKAGRVVDELVLTNYGTGLLELDVAVDIAADLARMDAIKAGRDTPEATPRSGADGLTLTWTDEHVQATVTVPAVPSSPRRVVVKPGESTTLTTTIEAQDVKRPLFMPVEQPDRLISPVTVEGSRHDLVTAVSRSVADLQALLLADGEHPEDTFVAAGAPWYLTLFGRDSLWATQFLLTTGTDLAIGTLRALARRQASDHDPTSQAEPGKILHEVRAEPLDLGGGVVIPPLYYGTIDATALWVQLLHGAWKHGAAADEIAALLPHLEAALGWIVRSSSDTGFLRYVDSTGKGLANQGWKDSADGIRHRDGSRGEAPIALCEVQAYAYAAAVRGAEIQRAFDVGTPERWETWAADLQTRFREHFWVDSPAGPHPAVALDARGNPVSALTSNIGHLLGTGICNHEEAAAIARHLVGLGLSTGYGLRTMSTDTAGYNPLGYHTGSVWTHDTMVAARGLAAEGFQTEAETLVLGLLDASVAFRGRLPELFGGYPAVPGGRPTAYAASCHPQGWSAASMVEGLRILLGLEVDAPANEISLLAAPSDVLSGHHVQGLRVAGYDLEVRVSTTGELTLHGADGMHLHRRG